MPSIAERLDALSQRQADTHKRVEALEKEFGQQDVKNLFQSVQKQGVAVKALQEAVQKLQAAAEAEWNWDWYKAGGQGVNLDPTLVFKADPSSIKVDENGLTILGHKVVDLPELERRFLLRPGLEKWVPARLREHFRRIEENDPAKALPALREQLGDARRRLAVLEGSVRGLRSRTGVAHNHIAGLRNSVRALRQRLVAAERTARNARTAAGQASQRITGLQGSVQGVRSRANAAQNHIAGLRNSVRALERRLTTRLTAVERRVGQARPPAAQAGRRATGARGPAVPQAGRRAAGARGGAAAVTEARRTQRALTDLLAVLRSTHPESRRFRREIAEIQRSLR